MAAPDPIRTVRILWGALLQSVLIYGAVGFIVVGEGSGLDPTMETVLMGAAVALAPAVFVLRFVLMGTVGLTVPPLPSAPLRATPEELATARERATQRYQTGTLVGCAVAEAIAIFGLVLSFLGGDPMTFLPFGVASAVLIAIQFPRPEVRDSLMPPEARAAAAAQG